MGIQISQIKGDLVELVFDPREEDLRVGDNLALREKVSGRGLIVQVLEFRTVSYPSLLQEMLRLAVDTSQPLPASLFDLYRGLPQTSNLQVATAKIRKMTDSRGQTVDSTSNRDSHQPSATSHQPSTSWEQWDGWIPTRDVEVEKTADDQVFANCLRDRGHLLCLGQTLYGQPFCLDGQSLEKVNIITGVKGAGKSHLAKVILLQLIGQGAPCLVFDINREYIHLPPHDQGRPGVIPLSAGGNFRLGVSQFGLAPLMTLLTKYGLPEVSALHFENRLARLLAEMRQWAEQGKRPPFLGIDQLIQMAEEKEFAPGQAMADVINGAIKSRLEALRHTGLFARHPGEAVSLPEYYQRIRQGGALVIELSALSNLARTGLVQALIEMIKDICEEEIAKDSHRFPFVFFEEAHLYIPRASIDYLVTRARHLGITSFFVTNMIGGLDEAVLRQADNLFLLYLPFEDDVRHVAKTAITDYQTIAAFVQRLRGYHALVIGQATGRYPLIFQVDRLEGIHTAGETKLFFKDTTADRRQTDDSGSRRTADSGRAASGQRRTADGGRQMLLPWVEAKVRG